MTKIIYETINKKIAIAPLKSDKIETKVVGGFATLQQKREIIAVVVKFGFSFEDVLLNSGDHILLRSDCAFKPWNKEVYTMGNEEFVLCPIEEVVGCANISWQKPEVDR